MRIFTILLVMAWMAWAGLAATPSPEEPARHVPANYNAPRLPSPQRPQLHWRSPVTEQKVTFAFEVRGKPPELMSMIVAMRARTPNLDDVQWVPFSTNLTVDFGPGEGPRWLWVGFSNKSGTDIFWSSYEITVQLSPPVLSLISPKERLVSRSMIQLQGFCSTGLNGPVPYEVLNQAGVVTARGEGLGDFEFTCYDVNLSPGTNTVVFHATDRAGFSVTTNFTLVFSTVGKTNPPVFQLNFPQDGTLLSGSQFTVDGSCDDPTAKVTALLCDERGNVTRLTGLLEREGRTWVEQVPLAQGINFLTIVVVDDAHNSSLTNITVGKSKYTLAMDRIGNPQQLWQGKITVTGYYSRSNGSVSVNGVKARMQPDGHWVAENVPVKIPKDSGAVSFNLQTKPNDEHLAPSQVWQPAFFGAPSNSLQAALSCAAVNSNQYNHYPITLGLTNLSDADQPHRWMLPTFESRFALCLWDQQGRAVSRTGALRKLGTALPENLNIHHLGSEELACLDGVLPLKSNAVVQLANFNLDEYFPRLLPGDYQLEVEARVFQIADDGRLSPLALPPVRANLTVLDQPSPMVFHLQELEQKGALHWGSPLNSMRIGVYSYRSRERNKGMRLEVFLENLGTNQLRGLRLPRLEEQFAISLLDATGAEVPKTAVGKARGQPLTQPNASSSAASGLGSLIENWVGIHSPRRSAKVRPLLLAGRDAIPLGGLDVEELFEIKTRGKYRLVYQQRLFDLNATNTLNGLTMPRVTLPLELP